MHQGLMNKKLRGGAAERKITESSMMRLMLLTLLMMMMTIMKEKNWDLFSCRLGLGLSKKSDSSQQQPRMEGHQFSADFWWQLRLKLSLIDASAEGKLNEKPKADFCGIQAGYPACCCCWEEILGGWGLKRGAVGTMLAGLSLDVSATVKGPDK